MPGVVSGCHVVGAEAAGSRHVEVSEAMSIPPGRSGRGGGLARRGASKAPWSAVWRVVVRGGQRGLKARALPESAPNQGLHLTASSLRACVAAASSSR